jgi:hypothetical protein
MASIHKSRVTLASLIACSALSPIMKQLLVFKILTGEDLGTYLFLSGLLLTLAPLIHMGWGDLFARQLAVGKKECRAHHLSALIISIVSVVAASAVTFIALMCLTDYGVRIVLLFSTNLLLVSEFQNAVKAFRSLNRLDSFFLWLGIKGCIDVVGFGGVVVSGMNVDLVTLMSVETGLSAVMAAFLYAYSRRPLQYDLGSLVKYYRSNHALALGLIGTNGIAILASNIDRLMLKSIDDVMLYNRYMFVIINTSLLYSLNALVFHFVYPKLAGVINDRKALQEFISKYVVVLCIAACIGAPLQTCAFYYFNIYIYKGMTVSIYQIALAVLLGWLGLALINETVLLLELRVKYLIKYGALSLVIYVGSFYVLRWSGELRSIYACYVPIMMSRMYYLWKICVAGAGDEVAVPRKLSGSNDTYVLRGVGEP